jgi:hypothetical protein
MAKTLKSFTVGSLPVPFKNKDDLVLTGVLGWSGDAILRGINSYNG